MKAGNFFTVKAAKSNDKAILLKGRTIRRPANQYHYILDKSISEEKSDVSSDIEENM